MIEGEPVEPTEPQIHARYSIGRSERIAVAVKTSRGSRFNVFVGFVCLILAATTLAMPLVSLGYMVCSAAMLTGFWMVPIALWTVRKEGRLSSEIDFAAGEDGVRIETISGKGTLKWPMIKGFREWPEAFLINVGPRMNLYVPKRAFDAGQVEALRSLLTSKLRPAAS
jgi:hypothetical protein